MKKYLWLLLIASSAQAAVYKIDPVHSSVGFRIAHLGGHVTGTFDKFEGTFAYDPKDVKVWKASATIDAASIDTRNEKRDHHLRSADFFETDKYPTITFVSTRASRSKMEGDLTMHGVTKKITLDIEPGEVVQADGVEHAGMTAKTTIKRADWGIDWNNPLAGGRLMIGETVDIVLEIEGIKEEK